MTFRVLDPTAGEAAASGQRAPRLSTLKGKTVGFISNGKVGTKGFFAHLETAVGVVVEARSARMDLEVSPADARDFEGAEQAVPLAQLGVPGDAFLDRPM